MLRYGTINLFSSALNTKDGLNLLEDNKLKSGCGREASPDGNETSVETARTILGDDLEAAIKEAFVDSGIRRLVHQSSADHIEWSNSAGHEEASSKGREELCDEALGEELGGLDHSLDLVIACHLGTIQHHRTHNIRLDSTVESHHSLRFVESTGSLTHGRRLFALSSHHALRIYDN